MKKCIILLVTIVLMSGMAEAGVIHHYTFNYFDARDEAGACDGILMNGATVNSDGSYAWVSCDGVNDFVDLVGPCIDLPQYNDGFTLKLWAMQPEVNQGWSMTAAFGDTRPDGAGTDYVAIATARGDDVSRAMICDGSGNPGWWGGNEMGVNGPELNDGKLHLYSLVVGPAPCCCQDGLFLSYYIDDVLMGVVNLWDGRTISTAISNNFAYLGKGLYTADATMLIDIYQFTIYDEALCCTDIAVNYALGPEPVPEPTTIALLGLGSLVLLRRRK
jgi:hypothetical protein